MAATPEAGVQALDSVGRVDDLADLGAVGEEGHELRPGGLPELDDRRVALAPLAGELGEAILRCLLGRRGVDGSQILRELVPVGAAGGDLGDGAFLLVAFDPREISAWQATADCLPGEIDERCIEKLQEFDGELGFTRAQGEY